MFSLQEIIAFAEYLLQHADSVIDDNDKYVWETDTINGELSSEDIVRYWRDTIQPFDVSNQKEKCI